MIYYSQEHVKEKLFEAIEAYNTMILGKKLASKTNPLFKPLSLAELKGMFYNSLKRGLCNSDFHFSIDKLSCEFNLPSGTIKDFSLARPSKNECYTYEYVTNIKKDLPTLEMTAVKNEISLIVNSIKR